MPGIPKGTLLKVRSRLQAAAYDAGGPDWPKLFRQYDTDHSGALDANEFRVAVRCSMKVPPRDMTNDEIGRLFRALDRDRSGCLEIEELLDFLGRPKEQPTMRLTKTRKSGLPSLDSAKLMRVQSRFKAAAYTVGGQDWERLFTSQDKDGSGLIELAELKGVVRRALKIPPNDVSDNEIRQLFKVLDEDASGALDLDEIIKFVRRDLAKEQGAKGRAARKALPTLTSAPEGFNRATKFGGEPRMTHACSSAFLGTNLLREAADLELQVPGPGEYGGDTFESHPLGSTVLHKSVSKSRRSFFPRRWRQTMSALQGEYAIMSMNGVDPLLFDAGPGPGSYEDGGSACFKSATADKGRSQSIFASETSRFTPIGSGVAPTTYDTRAHCHQTFGARERRRYRPKFPESKAPLARALSEDRRRRAQTARAASRSGASASAASPTEAKAPRQSRGGGRRRGGGVEPLGASFGGGGDGFAADNGWMNSRGSGGGGGGGGGSYEGAVVTAETLNCTDVGPMPHMPHMGMSASSPALLTGGKLPPPSSPFATEFPRATTAGLRTYGGGPLEFAPPSTAGTRPNVDLETMHYRGKAVVHARANLGSRREMGALRSELEAVRALSEFKAPTGHGGAGSFDYAPEKAQEKMDQYIVRGEHGSSKMLGDAGGGRSATDLQRAAQTQQHAARHVEASRHGG